MKTATESSNLGAASSSEANTSTRPQQNQLRKNIRSHVLPRLLNAMTARRSKQSADSPTTTTRRLQRPQHPGNFDAQPGDNGTIDRLLSVEDFTTLVLENDESFSKKAITRLKSHNISDDDILLQLLAPTAVELGQRWDRNLCGLGQVTIAMTHLQKLLRWIRPQHARQTACRAHGGRIALAQVPGEQHSMGVLVLADILYQRGWYTEVDIDTVDWQFPELVQRESYDLIGLSLSSADHLEVAREAVKDLRKQSRNPAVTILVGGDIINREPQLVEEVGADATAACALSCAEFTQRYVPVCS